MHITIYIYSNFAQILANLNERSSVRHHLCGIHIYPTNFRVIVPCGGLLKWGYSKVDVL